MPRNRSSRRSRSTRCERVVVSSLAIMLIQVRLMGIGADQTHSEGPKFVCSGIPSACGSAPQSPQKVITSPSFCRRRLPKFARSGPIRKSMMTQSKMPAKSSPYPVMSGVLVGDIDERATKCRSFSEKSESSRKRNHCLQKLEPPDIPGANPVLKGGHFPRTCQTRNDVRRSSCRRLGCSPKFVDKSRQAGVVRCDDGEPLRIGERGFRIAIRAVERNKRG